jgi:Porin PorA
MRRRAALVLLALAVFFGALAPALRWYAFPRLARVPANQYQAVVMEAKNATLLDYSTMTPKKVSKVTIVETLKGNVEAAKKVDKATGRHVVVWDGLSYIVGPDGAMVSEVPERYVFDAHSQEPVHAGGESVDGDSVTRTGIEYKWPFLTQKRDYEYFDAQTRTSAPIHYRGTRDFRGLTVYYFEQTVPWTPVVTPKKLPVKGITPQTVKAMGMQRWYTTVRRFWVEPTTGAPVYGEEVHKEEMRWTDGSRPPVTAFAGHVTMREDYTAHTVALVKSQRQLVLLLTTYLPWGFGALGAVLLVLALVLEARSRRAAPPGVDSPPQAAEPQPAPG